MTDFCSHNLELIQQISNLIQTKCLDLSYELSGIIIYGSATKIPKPRDLDILIIGGPRIPREKRILRGQVASHITSSLLLGIDLELRVKSLAEFAQFSPLHLGILEGYLVLFDPSNQIKKILRKGQEIRRKWGTKRIDISESTWILLPKGKLVQKKPIEYAENLLD